jgi:GNAT superfamily N-acetyltransferase
MKARRNAISRSGVVLDEPGITWETLTESPYAKKFTHEKQEYIFMHSEGISTKTVSRPSKIYEIPELYVKYKEQLEQFCNDTFPTELIEYYMGVRDFQLYFILRNDTKAGTVVIEAFMTIHMWQEHVGGFEYENLELGTICVGPKRSGLGRKCIELLQEMVEDERSRMDYLFLTPATGAAPFYKRLGFRMYEPKNENGNENGNGNGKHTYMIWCRPGATDPLC